MSIIKTIVQRYQTIGGALLATGGLGMLQARLSSLNEEIALAQQTLAELQEDIVSTTMGAAEAPVPVDVRPDPEPRKPRAAKRGTARGAKGAAVQSAFEALGVSASAASIKEHVATHAGLEVSHGMISRVRGELKQPQEDLPAAPVESVSQETLPEEN